MDDVGSGSCTDLSRARSGSPGRLAGAGKRTDRHGGQQSSPVSSAPEIPPQATRHRRRLPTSSAAEDATVDAGGKRVSGIPAPPPALLRVAPESPVCAWALLRD